MTMPMFLKDTREKIAKLIDLLAYEDEDRGMLEGILRMQMDKGTGLERQEFMMTRWVFDLDGETKLGVEMNLHVGLVDSD